jgi:hypothetical protein
VILFLAFAFLQATATICTAADRKEKAEVQVQLDKACEDEREKKLVVLRQQYVDECVLSWKESRAYCEKFYADYGAKTLRRAPLFYDLPECVLAHEYRQGRGS